VARESKGHSPDERRATPHPRGAHVDAPYRRWARVEPYAPCQAPRRSRRVRALTCKTPEMLAWSTENTLTLVGSIVVPLLTVFVNWRWATTSTSSSSQMGPSSLNRVTESTHLAGSGAWAAGAWAAGERPRSHRSRFTLMALLGLVLLIGFLISAIAVTRRAEILEGSGMRYSGTVVSVNQKHYGGGGSLEVLFRTPTGERRASITLNDSSPRYRVGQPTDVIVDRADEDHLSIPEETNQSMTTVVPMIVALVGGFVLLVAGVAGLIQTRRRPRTSEDTGAPRA
jgi:hypothetical protein